MATAKCTSLFKGHITQCISVSIKQKYIGNFVIFQTNSLNKFSKQMALKTTISLHVMTSWNADTSFGTNMLLLKLSSLDHVSGEYDFKTFN